MGPSRLISPSARLSSTVALQVKQPDWWAVAAGAGLASMYFTMRGMEDTGSARHEEEASKPDTEHVLRSSDDANFQVFESQFFSDEIILNQLQDTAYQRNVGDHQWDTLSAGGPDFVLLAASMASGKTLAEAIQEQPSIPDGLKAHLTNHQGAVKEAMKEVAESYLNRGSTQKTSRSFSAAAGIHRSADKLGSAEGPADAQTGHAYSKDGAEHFDKDKVIKSDTAAYRCVQFVAKGSGGGIYAAVELKDALSSGNLNKELHAEGKGAIGATAASNDASLVIKKIYDTQRDSADAEYEIAALLATDGGDRYTIPYLDRMEEHDGDTKHLCLLMRRVKPSAFGISLDNYMNNGFFGRQEHQVHAQAMVVNLLKGLDHVAKHNVVLRDVKPDNVLVESLLVDYQGGEKEVYEARWADFGLAVVVDKDKGLGGSWQGLGLVHDSAALKNELVKWWYCTQKLVPRPKWNFRRPPESAFQNPHLAELGSYDAYMCAIIFVCMATGVDFPHIDKPEIKKKAEAALGRTFSKDYLKTFELGAAMASLRMRGNILTGFKNSFGDEFGRVLFAETEKMLALKPTDRPSAATVAAALEPLH